MRILHIVGSINPAAGGPTEAIRMIIRYRPPGYEAEVATLDSPDAPFLGEFPFQVHALGNRRKSWYSPRLVPWLIKNRDRFDGIIVHGLWEFTGLAALLAVAGHKPYLVFTHGMLDPYFKRRYPLKHVKKWIYWILAQYWVLRAASRVMFTTELERDLATKTFWLWHWNPMVVSYGADPQLPDIDELVPAFYERCPELNVGANDRSYLLFLSRIHPKKGCDLLLQAFAVVAPAHPKLHLIMAGPDATGMRDDLQSIVDEAGLADRVHWPGMLMGDAKWAPSLSATRSSFLPTRKTSASRSAEALACGRPVLISDQVNIAPEIEAMAAASWNTIP